MNHPPAPSGAAPHTRVGSAQLAAALRAHAAGACAEFAAADLLVAHRTWLARPDFTTRFVHRTGLVTARVDWHAAAALGAYDLPCSGSEADVLRIAASLGAGVPVALRDVLGRLDTSNIAAVAAAVIAANGTA